MASKRRGVNFYAGEGFLLAGIATASLDPLSLKNATEAGILHSRACFPITDQATKENKDHGVKWGVNVDNASQ